MNEKDIDKNIIYLMNRVAIQSILIDVLYDIVRNRLSMPQDKISEMIREKALLLNYDVDTWN